MHVVQSLGHGGAEHFVIDLAQAQRSAGLVVEIVEVGPEPGPAGRAVGLPVTLVSKRRRADLPAFVALARRTNRKNPDVVHTHTFTGLCYGHPAAAIARVPAVVHTYHSSGAPGRVYGRWQFLVDALLRRSGAVAVFTEAQRGTLARRLGPRTRVAVVPNGVPAPVPLDAGARAAVRTSVGADGGVLVLAIGGLRQQKDYGLLLDAVAAARAHGCRAEVRVVGNGAEYSKLEQRRAGLGLDSVRFLGDRPDARTLLAAADVLVNTSRWESMPVAVLEAMAAGCALVVPDVGDLPQLVGDAGLVVPRTADGVAAGLESVVSDGQLRARLADAGRQLVRSRYSIESTSEQYASLYRALLGEAGTP